MELKSPTGVQWSGCVTLAGQEQKISLDLPQLEDIHEFVMFLEEGEEGDFVTIDQVSFTATNHIEDTALAAFVWSYGMLLDNWDPQSGLVRDKAKNAPGEFDAIQATGGLVAVTPVAFQLGIMEYDAAVAIVNKIADTLLNDIPHHHGLSGRIGSNTGMMATIRSFPIRNGRASIQPLQLSVC